MYRVLFKKAADMLICFCFCFSVDRCIHSQTNCKWHALSYYRTLLFYDLASNDDIFCTSSYSHMICIVHFILNPFLNFYPKVYGSFLKWNVWRSWNGIMTVLSWAYLSIICICYSTFIHDNRILNNLMLK